MYKNHILVSPAARTIKQEDKPAAFLRSAIIVHSRALVAFHFADKFNVHVVHAYLTSPQVPTSVSSCLFSVP